MTIGYIILETGEVFSGKLIGNVKRSDGELVFNTSMIGHKQILTNPSSTDQIIVFSYPIIGNNQVQKTNLDSNKFHARGVVTGELSNVPSHNSIDSVLGKNQIPCLTEVDTRALIKTIRKRGTVRAVITNEKNDKPKSMECVNPVKDVSTKTVVQYADSSYGPHIVVVDFGVKQTIVQYLLRANYKVTLVPYDYPLEKILLLNPDGIVLSNGPGDPMDLTTELDKIYELSQRFPTFGIGLGHQLVALAYGAKTEALPFGHRGGNYPVKDLRTGKVYITTQNHGYTVINQTIDRNKFDIAFQNVNDGTVEGLVHKQKPIQTVQFYPETQYGQQETDFIFQSFFETVKKNIGVMSYAVK
ncbi:carbamoyl phosphate synthase small subunit [Pallidibacillus pasinlerensis]|uniref:Carbamoyl phosphate synthase small chain n=1 Tax=Pallidibacillus pasinlerensis TaxID=2703818 RepID=A0ABX0A5R7_9BACI|nr:carbamoyl phosphate synthase small subunit [Pallidibacillus pasinlerensis]NCU17324.1 carbamoyl phosphate synthase small subunit [Pallidibacillus pasinlerensis]